MKEGSEVIDRDVFKRMRDQYVRSFGDPDSPEGQSAIDETIEVWRRSALNRKLYYTIYAIDDAAFISQISITAGVANPFGFVYAS